MSWASMRDRMNRKNMRALNDGPACYQGASGSPQDVPEVMIDFNIARSGPEGVFLTEQTGITYRKDVLCSVARGGIFIYDGRRFVVEEEIADDGMFVTVACMEQRR